VAQQEREGAIMSTTVELGDKPGHRHRLAKRLGVPKLLKGHRDSVVAVHEALHAGLPSSALLKAIPPGIPLSALLPVFGIGLRTFMRLKHTPHRLLDANQSVRVWRFTELFAKAEDVLGAGGRAVEWMLEPAMALENRRPIDLLTTSIGAQLVDDVIERMRYGVYQ
jgi:putative toxin-antitoxin system antitoxin component (TIGR02293 family)